MTTWIKMSANLGTHPKVVRIASALKADRLRVVGGLHAVWCLFDAHSIDGSLDGYTLDAIDDLIGWRGFASAMVTVEWLEADESRGVILPRYDTHNGASAKRRAQEADRKREARSGPHGVRDSSASAADKMRTREEKIREEPKPPRATRVAQRFDEFWKAWPRTDRKVNRKGCEAKWKARGLDAIADHILAKLEAFKATRKWRDGFSPLPMTWINADGWDDEVIDGEPRALKADGEVRQWFDTATGITARGKEEGVEQEPGEPFPHFKARVFQKVGHVEARRH